MNSASLSKPPIFLFNNKFGTVFRSLSSQLITSRPLKASGRVRQIYLLDFESGSQQELLVLMSDLDVVDFVLVEDHQGEGLIGQLPGAVPHQVRPVLRDTDTENDIRTGRHRKPEGKTAEH